ncbi:hypothetical protein Droror1_Dr00005576 [Drosera rotundifolia]
MAPRWLRRLIANFRVAYYDGEDCACHLLSSRDCFCLGCGLSRCPDCTDISPHCNAAGHIQSMDEMQVVRHNEVQGHVDCSDVRRYRYCIDEWVLVVRRRGLPLAPPDPCSIPCASRHCIYYFSSSLDADDQEYADPRKLYCSLNCMVEDRREVVPEQMSQIAFDHNNDAPANEQNNYSDAAAAELNGHKDAAAAEQNSHYDAAAEQNGHN